MNTRLKNIKYIMAKYLTAHFMENEYWNGQKMFFY